ncbi:winged helix-turn-helix domain-containing protein [Nocardia sp. GAS34]|uniref:winged helix-turn-helix domain-containing protein n=1 Tax=unclassified Nocardia TaxID=2637762 RepID=UPI003D1DC97F
MWTLARVVEVIENLTGVRYSITGTWEIVRGHEKVALAHFRCSNSAIVLRR